MFGLVFSAILFIVTASFGQEKSDKQALPHPYNKSDFPPVDDYTLKASSEYGVPSIPGGPLPLPPAIPPIGHYEEVPRPPGISPFDSWQPAPLPQIPPIGHYEEEPRPPGIEPYQNAGKCQKIKQLNVRGHRTARAKFVELERDGKTYIAISCPNTGKPYALVAEKNGGDTIFHFGSEVIFQDTVLLSSGFNLDFTVRCDERNTVARAYNGRKVSIRRVACVELPQPNPVTKY
ncbi:Protein CBG15572 [Caenorhabditis briggsae]|uniref:Uncharacterized protein n=2 Tax=Caenorhabditis briggsae TaxID=6238 RepID=A0AAE8ZTI9_CAEBR|nr:Protein CBG15572 [Caenorhabditis briggsae]ULT83748.1 hypothetical protein L3Y34_012779 [Caenorhabditis briggsae]CAP33720.1 Protein CBG15572 [Caenorhabditis briggsae]